MPAEYRQSLLLYQPMIVFGPRGSGKSALVETCTAWKGLEAQFHPSDTSSPHLQIYHGPQQLVLEVSEELLLDTSSATRKELKKLWRPLTRGKPPRVLLTLDATSLGGESEERLRMWAQALRGKLNILSQLCRGPIELRLVLTHADHLAGYLEFVGLLQRISPATELKLECELTPQNLENCLDRYHDFLPHSLIILKAEEHMELASFFLELPEVLRPLCPLLEALQLYDPLAVKPQLTGLYLTSTKSACPGVSNPLATTISEQEVKKFRPQRKHQLVAASLAALGLIWMLAGYLRERVILSATNELVPQLIDPEADKYQAAARQKFFSYLKTCESSPWAYLLPDFVSGHPRFVKQPIYQKYITTMRNDVFFPVLRSLSHKLENPQRYLYFLALTYATRQNGLGRLIEEHAAQWQRVTGLSPEIIRDYTLYNETTEDLDWSVDRKIFNHMVKHAINQDYSSWVMVFTEVGSLLRRPDISKRQLAEIQLKVSSIPAQIDELVIYKAVDLLQREAALELERDWQKAFSKLPVENKEALAEAAALIQKESISHRQVQGLTLSTLLETMDKLLKKPPKDKVLQFSIEENPFTFSSAAWSQLILRSNLTLLLQGFLSAKGQDPFALFFEPQGHSVTPQPVVPALATTMPGATQEPLVQQPRQAIDRRFTKQLFEEQMKPALAELPAMLQRLPLIASEKERLKQAVLQALMQYAARYVEAYTNYYASYGVQASSVSELRFLLSQLQGPSSPLLQMLVEIGQNTALPLDAANPFHQPLAIIPSTFAFVQTLVGKKEGSKEGSGGAALLEKYLGLVAQMSGEIGANEGMSGPGGGGGEGEKQTLRDTLPPLGKIALAIYLEQATSYLRLTEAWLGSASVMQKWHEPFLGPIKIAYRLGLAELENAVATTWQGLYTDFVAPLRFSFPFNPESEQSASAATIEAAFHPKSEFWNSFKSLISPLCQKRRGAWVRREGRQYVLKLPAGMLTTVNSMSRVSQVLWDGQGRPQPLKIKIKPLPFPPQGEDSRDYNIVMAILQAGEGAVTGFNQAPRWQELALKWWQPEATSVSAVFVRMGKRKKVYVNLPASDAMWSFYRLLRHSHRGGLGGGANSIWDWKIKSPSVKSPLVDIRFQIQGNPWDLVRVKL
jgi:type VI secretion system protein ImpL